MTILGIDPGTAIIGYGLVTSGKKPECIDYGVIETPKIKTKGERLCLLEEEMEKLLDEHSPDVVAVESLFFAKNTKTAMAVAEAKGVILLCLARKKLPVHEFSPPQIKMTVTGNGKADKKQVWEMLQNTFKSQNIPKQDDTADAIAVSLTYFFTNRYS